MKKAIFFDIDGTLIDCINGHIDLSHQVKQAIRRLQQEGHYAFIATGRPYAFLSEAILSFGFDGYILTSPIIVSLFLYFTTYCIGNNFKFFH